MAWRTAVLACSAIAAGGLATGVAGAVPSTTLPGAVPSGRVCAEPGSVDRLVVTRTDAFPQNHITFSFPARVVVREVAAARTVARAVCALPVRNTSGVHCPADMGVDYHLAFRAPDRTLAPVVVDAMGCTGVTGSGEGRQWATTELWTVLGRAMGLPHPGEQAFRGSGPDS